MGPMGPRGEVTTGKVKLVAAAEEQGKQVPEEIEKRGDEGGRQRCGEER